MRLKSFIHTLMILTLAISVAGCLFTSCSESEKKHSAKLEKAIDLFYLENKNDSVLMLLETLPAEKLSAGEVQLATIFRAAAVCETGKPDSALTILRTVDQDKLPKEISYYYGSILGLIRFRQFQPEEAYHSLITLDSEASSDIRAVALTERLISRIMIYYGDDKNAIDWLMHSRRNFEKAGLEKSVAINNRLLGNISVRLKLYGEARQQLDSAISVFKKYNDGAELFFAYAEMTEYFIRQNKPDSALQFIAKARNAFDVTSYKSMLALLSNNRGEIEKLKGNYPAAIQMFDSTLRLGTGYYYSQIRTQTAFLNLAEIYNRTEQPDSARKYALNALNTVSGKQKDKIKYAVYYQLAKSYVTTDITKMQAYMDSAIYHLDKYQASQSVDLIRYFNTRKDLKDSHDMIEELKAAAIKYRINFLILILFVIFIVSAMMHIFYVQKDRNKALRMLVQKNLKLLEKEVSQQQEAWNRQNNNLKKKIHNGNDEEKLQAIYTSFIHWLSDEGNFRRKDLTLSVASKELNTNRDYLSRAINEQNLHFNDLVNKYRVMEIIRVFSTPSDPRNKLTLQILATEVGFNSNSVFIDAFRRITGMTPTRFKEHLTETDTQPKVNN